MDGLAEGFQSEMTRPAISLQYRAALVAVALAMVALPLLYVALGLAAAWGVSQILKSLVAQIPALDPVTFVGITLLLTTVMLTACLIPARRATRMDPLAALRVE